ncbi:MAG: CoA transferase [Polymorphobacter sp.]
MTAKPPILADIRIVDLSEGRAGQLAAMLLAEAGADVVHIEPPGGDPARGSAGFAVHNRSKTSLVIDIASVAGRAELENILDCADVLIHDRADAWLASEAVVSRHPHIVCSQIGSWPAGHPRAGTPPDDALVLAEAGICDEQRGVGRDGPIFLRFPLGEGGAAYLAAIGVLARLLAKRHTCAGGAADTSIVQGALTSVIMLWSRAETPTPGLARGWDKAISAYQFECADGEWIHVMSNPDVCPTMHAGLTALDADIRAAAIEARNGAPVVPSFGANALVFRQHPREFWLAELWAHDVSVQPVLPMGKLYDDDQARQNGYVVAVDDLLLGPTLQPGSPLHVEPPATVRSPAPSLDDGRAAIALWDARPPPAPGIILETPLQGLKVLDLGNFLAGPFAAMILSSLGAEVIKLEAASGDMMRHAEWAFAACQRGKRSIALNLKDPASRPVLERLVQWADVVHHNLRMPAATKLGLDYATIKAINPSVVYCHVSSYGAKGPRKDWPGFDQLFQASCGWEYEGAGAGNPPIWYRFGMMDHQCAMASTVATLLALLQRANTGEGSAVAASLLGAGMMTLRETIALPDGSVTPYPRLDSQQIGVSTARRLFQCKDGWIMAVTETRGALDMLQTELGLNLEAAMAGLDCDRAISAVRRAGGFAVHAAENQREAFFDDPANAATGLVVAYPHPRYGRFEQIGSFFQLGDLKTRIDRAPPMLGEHSCEILMEFGFMPDAIEAMIASKIVVAA